MANDNVSFETYGTVGPVRLTWQHLFEPYARKAGATPKYSTGIMVPKSDTKSVATLQKMYQEAKKKFAHKWPNVTPVSVPIQDGDKPNRKGKINEDYKGHYIISCSVNKKPPLLKKVAGRLIEITNPGEIYSGCWGFAELNMFPFNNESTGISCGLNSFCKTRDDKSFEGGSNPEEAYADIPDSEEGGQYGNAAADNSNDDPFK